MSKIISEAQINSIINDKAFRDYCRVTTRGNNTWKDLYQEFCLAVLEGKCRPNDESKLNSYCLGMIKNIYRQRFDKKSVLFSFASEIQMNDNVPEQIEDITGYDVPALASKVAEVLSTTTDRQRKIFSVSINSNLKKFCKQENISYSWTQKQNSKLKKHIHESVGSISDFKR